MSITQENRLIAVDTVLGKDVLLLTGFHGEEGLNRLFSFELSMLSENHNIAFERIIGTSATVSVVLADGGQRFFHGLISSFSQGRGGAERGGDQRFSFYKATVVPWLWVLTRTSDSRIFQELTAPEIIEKIFGEYGFSDFSMLLRGSYEKREYCVQYRETDFNFISRLLEEEGIYYFFRHEKGRHVLVLADTPEEHKPCPGQESARYRISAGGRHEEDEITSLERIEELRPGKYTLNDYNFEMPGSDMKVSAFSRHKRTPGEREMYDYPGLYFKRGRGDRLVTVRMEEEEARITVIVGSSDCRAFSSGFRFVLTSHYRDDMNNKAYLLVSMVHEATQEGGYPGTSGQGSGLRASYVNHFSCIPLDVPYRPPRETVKPTVRGTQTAFVVGPAGEEIYTDEYGRIKVQFHWDREGRRNENSSCWMRVGQLWAGAGWGAVYIPRIGQEVIVDFLEGDPDRPIVIGCVYHANNKPPYELPEKKTRSVIKSESTLGGRGYNEISFEDKKGEEEIYVHAERDHNTFVENDRTATVTRNDTETVKEGDQTTTIEKGNKAVAVNMGDMNIGVPMGAYKLSADTIVIEAKSSLTLKCTGGTITINGQLVKIN